MSRLASLADAAVHTGTTEKTIRRWASQGRIRAWRLGPRLIRVDLEEIDAMLSPIPTVGVLPVVSTVKSGRHQTVRNSGRCR